MKNLRNPGLPPYEVSSRPKKPRKRSRNKKRLTMWDGEEIILRRTLVGWVGRFQNGTQYRFALGRKRSGEYKTRWYCYRQNDPLKEPLWCTYFETLDQAVRDVYVSIQRRRLL